MTARSRGRRAARRRSTRARACRCVLEELDPTASCDVDAARRRLPARRRRARRRRSCASAASASSTCPPTSGCSDRDVYAEWYGEHGAPELLGEAVYGLPELYREEIARRRARRQPRLLPDRGDARRSAPLAARGPARRRRHRREVRRLRRRPRAADGHALRRGRREPSRPTRSARHRHTPEIEQELRRRRVRVTFTPHLVPLAQGELVSCYVDARPRDDADARRALPRRLRGRAVGRGRRRARPACTRCARRTSAASPCTATRARAG